MPNTVFCIYNSCDTFLKFLLSANAPQTNIPIYISSTPDNNNPYIMFNVEQLTNNHQLDKLIRQIKAKPPLEIWDYSEANINILKLYDIKLVHVVVQSDEIYLQQLCSWRTDIIYDVGFCGGLSERRRQILDECKRHNLNVHIITITGEERDKELAKCKILINIHYATDYNIFEIARCEPWLSIGVPVVSEHSLDNDSRCINVEYTDLVQTVINMC